MPDRKGTPDIEPPSAVPVEHEQSRRRNGIKEAIRPASHVENPSATYGSDAPCIGAKAGRRQLEIPTPYVALSALEIS